MGKKTGRRDKQRPHPPLSCLFPPLATFALVRARIGNRSIRLVALCVCTAGRLARLALESLELSGLELAEVLRVDVDAADLVAHLVNLQMEVSSMVSFRPDRARGRLRKKEKLTSTFLLFLGPLVLFFSFFFMACFHTSAVGS